MLPVPLVLALATLTQGAARPFPAILWPKAGNEAPSAQQREFGATCVSRGDPSAALREAGVDVLVFNAAGRDELHLEPGTDGPKRRRRRWLETQDSAALVRQPCLASDETRAKLGARLAESLKSHAGACSLGVSLGDEIGLTPGGIPEDVCLCASCEAQWAARGGKREKLAALDTDRTLRAVFDGDTLALGPWLERRTFHQEQLQETLARLAEQAKAQHVPVGVLGLVGQTAFGGVSIEALLPKLDFLECYRVGNARELAFSLRAPEQRVYLTVFATDEPARTAWAAWEHRLRGGDGVFVWSEAELEGRPKTRARLVDTLARIRALGAESFMPRPAGMAVLHSPRSVAAGWIRDALPDGGTWPNRFASWQEEHGSVETARKRWIDLAEACGAMPGALALETLRPEQATRFPLLVASELLVVDEADVARLEAFVAAGARLCVEGTFAWIDSTGRKWSDEERAALLVRLKAISPPDSAREWIRGASATAPLRAFLREQRVALAPFELQGASAQARWIVTWDTRGSTSTCAALPELPAEGASWPTALELTPRDGLQIQWLEPRGASGWSATLAPGDAAVFVLRASVSDRR